MLTAPMAGWAGPLDEAPDPVFAGRLLGDGLAIDPTEGLLRAPCDGRVAYLARTRHAVTLACAGGAEVLMHVGLETVALAGEGFQALVAEGQAVRAGDPLLRFDLDVLAGRARSLLTPVVVANGEAFEIVERAPPGRVAAGDILLRLRPLAADTAEAPSAAGRAEREVVTGLEHGLHARPAARVAEAARAGAARVTLAAHGRTADARSPVSLMALGLRLGDAVHVSAEGEGAAAAVEAVAERLEPMAAAPAPPPPAEAPEPAEVRGVTAAPGLAVGVAVRLAAADAEVPDRGGDPAGERRALEAARARVGDRLRARAAGAGAAAEVAAAHLALLDDPVLEEDARRRIDAGASAGAAWRAALRAQAGALAALGDRRMAERQADLLDLERQVIAEWLGRAVEAQPLPPGAVVLAAELLPSELAALDPARLAGVATEGGGPTAHVAIIAAAMGVPMLAACGPGLAAVKAGAPVALDADAGVLHVRPAPDALARLEGRRARRAARIAAAAAGAAEPCRTADGVRIEVFANLGAPGEAAAAVARGAEGCGLLRTEFLFQDRATAPDEEEQRAAYQAVADGLAGRPLTLRTLDIGADKPAPYLALPREENPALGLRGVRIGLQRPQVLRTQLRAALRVYGARLSLMLPMVATLDELRSVRQMLEGEAAELGVAAPPLGIMVETPAAAVTAALLAREAAFFSIGTNDLTQYALAMDRTQPALAAQLDGLHPAVLALVAQAVRGAQAHGRPVGVCGGLAADPLAAPLLIGLGARELSAAPARVAEVKAAVRTLDLGACTAFAAEALAMASAAEVRAAVRARFPQLDDDDA